MWFKALPAELRNRIVSRHRSGEGYKNSAALKVHRRTVASVILKRKTGTTRALLGADHRAKLSIGEGPW